MPPTTIRRSLLIAAVDSLDVPVHLDPPIKIASKDTSDSLIVVVVSNDFALDSHISRTQSWTRVQSILTHIYVQATKVAHEHNNVLLNVSVLLNSSLSSLCLPINIDMCFRVHADTDPDPVPLPDSLLSLPQTILSARPPQSSVSSLPHPTHLPLYPVVALGGTFDHLHAGHKILLSMAAWIASRKVIVGITVDALLKKKSNPQLLESFELRSQKTRAFLNLFRPDLQYDLVEIQDVYGPTGFDPDIQALVVSKETLSGATAIDNERARKGLPPLQTFVIDVISADSSNLDHRDAEILKQTKMSSTFIREWIASNQSSSVSQSIE